MKIFVDTAKISEIEQAVATGILDGITTNPSLMKKAMQEEKVKDLKTYINKILKLAGKKPVSLEVNCCSAKDMYKQAKNLWKTFKKPTNNVVIKVPLNPTHDVNKMDFEGLKTVKQLAKENIPTNVTLVFTPEQALLAAKAGATYVSPFAGRIDDELRALKGKAFKKSDYYPAKGKKGVEDHGIVSGVDLVDQIVTIFQIYEIKTEVIAASIRNAQQAREVALVGSDIATLPFHVIEEMTEHPKTYEGMVKFMHDVEPAYEKILLGK